MNLFECLRVALGALRTNTLRSVLTTLGIIIGVASVIVMVAVGSGARSEIERRINSLGTNLLQVQPGSARVSGRRAGAGTNLPLSEGDLAAIRTQVPGVAGASGSLTRAAPVVYESANWLTTIRGVHADFPEVRAWSMRDGRFFTEAEDRTGAKLAVLGATVARQLFADQDPTGVVVRIQNAPFTVLGVLDAKGHSTSDRDQDDAVLIPMTSARLHIMSRNRLVPDQVGSISVKVENGHPLAEAKEEIEAILRERRRVRPGEEDNFFVRDLAEYLRARTETQRTLGALLGATASIALIVGGIGIMNIMLVSVTERTREIGLRLAVGARRRDILSQFLVEAVALCLLGGLIGLGIGLVAAVAIAVWGEWPVLISLEMVLLALAAAAATGITFGFYPARQAARLNPIDALRSE